MRQLTALFIIFLFASCSKDVTITPQSLCEKNNTYFVEVHATVNNLDVIFYQGNQTVKPMQTYRMKINEVKSFEFPADSLYFIGFEYDKNGNKEFWKLEQKACENLRFSK